MYSCIFADFLKKHQTYGFTLIHPGFFNNKPQIDNIILAPHKNINEVYRLYFSQSSTKKFFHISYAQPTPYIENRRFPPDTQHYSNIQKTLDLYDFLIYYSVRYSGIVQSVEQRTVKHKSKPNSKFEFCPDFWVFLLLFFSSDDLTNYA